MRAQPQNVLFQKNCSSTVTKKRTTLAQVFSLGGFLCRQDVVLHNRMIWLNRGIRDFLWKYRVASCLSQVFQFEFAISFQKRSVVVASSVEALKTSFGWSISENLPIYTHAFD